MSQMIPEHAPTPTPTPTQKRPFWKDPAYFIIPAITLLAGFGIGSAGGADAGSDIREVPVPGPTVTVTATPVAAEATTSAACLNALDAADETIEFAAKGFGLSSEGFMAAADFDVDTLERVTNDLKAMTPGYEQALTNYVAAREECRNG